MKEGRKEGRKEGGWLVLKEMRRKIMRMNKMFTRGGGGGGRGRRGRGRNSSSYV